MIWRLSERVWWGNWESPYDQASEEVESALCVAYNPAMPLSAWDMRFRRDGRVRPVLWLGAADEQAVPRSYFRGIIDWTSTCLANDWFPTLVYCNAGQNRSPTAAICMEAMLSGRNPLEVLQDARRNHRADIAESQIGADGISGYHYQMMKIANTLYPFQVGVGG